MIIFIKQIDRTGWKGSQESEEAEKSNGHKHL